LTSLMSRTVAAPARRPAVMSSMESPTCVKGAGTAVSVMEGGKGGGGDNGEQRKGEWKEKGKRVKQSSQTYHKQALGIIQAPSGSNVQNTRRVRFRRAKSPRDDGVEGDALQELLEEVRDGAVEVAGADGLGHGMGLEVRHQRAEARLRHLQSHGGALDGFDLLQRGALRCSRQRVDVL
jgi:hypothetical protein